jgi:hypothetical protein
MNEADAQQAQAELAYLDQEDYGDQVDAMEEQGDHAESVEWAEVPARRKQDSLYTLFQKVWKTPDSSKVANLSFVELGRPVITVRDAKYLALLALTFKHHRFAQFFLNAAEITLATSASKKGWFTELFVSQKKFTTRSTGFSEAFGQQSSSNKKKWSIFGSNQPAQEY